MEQNDADQACGNCRHFDRIAQAPGRGNCHRYPPTLLVTGMQAPPLAGQRPMPIVESFWTAMREDSFCGEHSPGAFKRKAPIATADQVAKALENVEIEGSA
jgi:hypothetical protein